MLSPLAMDSKAQEQAECPKCRTLNPENCHSMHCPMRKEPCAYEEECQHPACNCGSMINPFDKKAKMEAQEQKPDPKCTLSNEELFEAAHKAITDMCQRQRWQMTVPVDFNRDSDMLLSEVCSRFKSATEENERLVKAIETHVEFMTRNVPPVNSKAYGPWIDERMQLEHILSTHNKSVTP